MILTFTNEEPEYIDYSEALDYIPRDLLAETFAVSPETFPKLPPSGDRYLVKMEQASDSSSPSSPNAHPPQPYTVNHEQVPPKVYEGGTVNELTVTQIPHLEGVTLFSLTRKASRVA